MLACVLNKIHYLHNRQIAPAYAASLARKRPRRSFPQEPGRSFPFQIHTVLTDNGMAFADRRKSRDHPSRRFLGPHIFDRASIVNGIEHRPTKRYHPWTNGQAERMTRTIKDATVKVYHYDDLESLKTPCHGLHCRLQLCDGEHPARSSATHGPRTRQSSKSTAPSHCGTHTQSPPGIWFPTVLC